MKKKAQKESLRYSEDAAWNVVCKYLNIRQMQGMWGG
jgi:hypothetical protein